MRQCLIEFKNIDGPSSSDSVILKKKKRRNGARAVPKSHNTYRILINIAFKYRGILRDCNSETFLRLFRVFCLYSRGISLKNGLQRSCNRFSFCLVFRCRSPSCIANESSGNSYQCAIRCDQGGYVQSVSRSETSKFAECICRIWAAADDRFSIATFKSPRSGRPRVGCYRIEFARREPIMRTSSFIVRIPARRKWRRLPRCVLVVIVVVAVRAYIHTYTYAVCCTSRECIVHGRTQQTYAHTYTCARARALT